MTIKKLTMAAAIAVGIATCSLNQAMAACPCTKTQPIQPAPCAEPLPVVTGQACPCTPQPKCNDCQKAFDECDCNKKPDCGCNDDCAIGYITVECPSCKKETSFDIEMFDENTNYIECPNCHKKIEVVYEDTDDCDCHCDK